VNDDIAPLAHLGDAEIMRLLDGDDPDEAARSELHALSCGHCADQVAALRKDAATVRAWLDRAAFEEEVLRGPHLPAPAQTPSRGRRARAAAPWLRAAAVLLLLAAPVAAVPALRQLLADTIADLRGGDRAGVEAVTATAGNGTTVRFVPDGGDFVVRFDEPQSAGSLRLGYSASDEAVLRVLGDAGEGPVVSAQSVHVRNTTGSAASYLLEVPPAITRLRIQIAGRMTVVLDAAELRAGVELPVR
jgi:hypothetical protein